jgi:hypothetical protein
MLRCMWMAVLAAGTVGLWLSDEGARQRLLDDARTAIKQFERSIRSDPWFSR